MTNLHSIPCAALTATLLCAPAFGQSALEQKLKDKLSQPWVKNATWITDFDKAKAKARAEGKQIFGYFTRSYAP